MKKNIFLALFMSLITMVSSFGCSGCGSMCDTEDDDDHIPDCAMDHKETPQASLPEDSPEK